MPSYCSSCGTALRDGAKFCGKCGTKVEETKPTKPVRTIQTTHSSKTKIVILAVVIIVVAGAIGYLLFSNLFQSGMIQNNTSQTDTNKFIGKWKGMTGTDVAVYYTLYMNGTMKTDYTDSGGETVMWNTYLINGSNIYIANSDGSSPEIYYYEFSNNDTQVILSQNGTPWIIASKVQ